MQGKVYVAIALLFYVLTNEASASQAESTEMPSTEMLEFLSEWQTDNGELVDPAEMEQIVFSSEELNNEER